jgi:hypothetical protein
MLQLYDWYELSFSGDNKYQFLGLNLSSDFLAEPEFWGGLVTLLILFVEVWLFWNIVKFLRGLFRLHGEIQSATSLGAGP